MTRQVRGEFEPTMRPQSGPDAQQQSGIKYTYV